MYHVRSLLFGLLVLFTVGRIRAQNPLCDFYQFIQPGQTYTIANPNYPNPYSGALACRWSARSTTRVRLTCNEFNIPSSPNCIQDTFDVYQSPLAGPRRYCGSGSFSVESTGADLIATLKTTSNTPGGRFLCLIEAISPPPPTCSCGYKNPMRIVGGQETGVNEYPMMAGLIHVANREVHCGGTIISQKYVLTAAHCLINLTPQQAAILVGDHDISRGDDTNAAQLLPVQQFRAHPAYSTNARINDIAIVTVQGTITFSNKVGPACLPFRYVTTSFAGDNVDVLGWGTTDFGGPPSNTLQKVVLRVTDYLSCQRVQPNLADSQICTYSEGKDSCQFDSGGPILWRDPNNGRLVLVGIIGYGQGCATSLPAVNTKVSSFLDWIVTNTPDAQYCRV